MKRSMGIVLATVLLLTGVSVLGGCAERTVKVKTGEIVLCTAGEVVEDNTREVEVPVDEVSKYSVTTKLITCDVHSGLATLYEAAQKAIAEGDLEAAQAKLEQVVAKDPSYKKAASQLREIKSGVKPVPDAPGGDDTSPEETATPSPDDDGEVTGPVTSLIAYIPDTLPGYSAQEITADPTLVTRNYIPTSGNADLLVISAEQVASEAMAAQTIASLKTAYPESGATVDLGSVKGYFGTINQFALITFSEGPIVVSVEMHAAKGKALDLKSELVKVATLIAK
ncbi:MAG: hypothetical protein LLG24_08635 [Actinomycetia bacterium]|nr:hypothetical protein [Actinomycetes bacterium]